MVKTPTLLHLDRQDHQHLVSGNGHFSYIKGNLERFGAGHAYHDARWRWVARKRSPLTRWNYDKESIFGHNPKTAGTSIYEMFAMERTYDTHVPVAGYQAADAALFKRAFKFAVVRNPWDRLVSAFQYLKHGTTSSSDIRWEQDEWWSKRYLAGIDSFPDFLQALQVPKFRHLVLTWRHFIPQHYFITIGKSGHLMDYLIRFEDFDRGVQAVASKVGLQTTLVQRNVSKRLGMQHYYNEADIRFVGQLYSRDVELFGYNFPSPTSVTTAPEDQE
jgi:hypothetical protein